MKKKRSWAWLIIVVLVLAALVVAVVLQRALRVGATNLASQQYEIEQVTKGDIHVTVHGTGTIAAMDTSTVTAGASAKVDSLLVENGDEVKAGQVIAKLNADAVNDNIQSLKDQIAAQDATIASMRAAPAMKTLYSPVNARVKAVYAKQGEGADASMSAYGALMVLSTDGKMKVRFVPEGGASVQAGEAVKVTVGSVTVDGIVSSVPSGSGSQGDTGNEAVAVVSTDGFPLSANAVVKDTSGSEIGKGPIELNKPLLITANSGTVDRIYVTTDERIKAGKSLVKLDGYILNPSFDTQIQQRQKLQDNLDKAYDDLNDLTITAPADGVVTDLSIQQGGMAQQGMAVCTIQQNASFKLDVAVDELDIPGIKVGQKATVKIDALPDAQATGEVTKIASVGVVSNDVTTYDVTLKLDAPAGTLVNMSASADIQVAYKTGVLLVPVEALHTVNGKTFVYGTLPGDIDPSATAGSASGSRRFGGFFSRMGGGSGAAGNRSQQRQTIEVSVGLVGDTYAEILSGLNEGDKIAVPVAQSSTAGMFNIGGARGNGGGSSSAKPAATSEAVQPQN